MCGYGVEDCTVGPHQWKKRAGGLLLALHQRTDPAVAAEVGRGCEGKEGSESARGLR